MRIRVKWLAGGVALAAAFLLGTGAITSEWSAKRQWKREHPACAVCGTETRVEIAHIVPRSVSVELRACPTNYVSLCRSHHIWINHCGDGACRNWNGRIEDTILAVTTAWSNNVEVRNCERTIR